MTPSRFFQFVSTLLLTTALASCAATPPAGPAALSSAQELSRNGPYQIRSYIGFPDAPEYGNATIYYPLDAEAPVGGVAPEPWHLSYAPKAAEYQHALSKDQLCEYVLTLDIALKEEVLRHFDEIFERFVWVAPELYPLNWRF